MEFSVSASAEGAAVIRPTGKLNMVSASRLRSEVARVVGEGRSRVVVDLADVDFIDSSGLGALISGLKTTRQAGGDLRLANPSQQVSLVLGLTNMDRVLAVVGDPERAFGG